MKQEFPKGAIKSIQGRSFTIKGDDIDTDRIIPARFLKCVSFSALGEQVFADDRKELNGNHPFDLDHNKGANILVVNDNFGCGSSREHAPQALMRWGIRLIIGESFAEIFFGNCLALGIPCLTASKEKIVKLQNLVEKNKHQIWNFNLKNLSISNQKETFKLNLGEGPYNMLYSGKWDATSQLLDEEEKINKTFNNLPYLNNFKLDI
jgi:3-isopropylmalate/(R)-2-methylmalate dehydratase small subunit